MGWADTWSDIHSGGNPRWKITCSDSHQAAFSKFQRFIQRPDDAAASAPSVFCPLAGDDPFVHLLFSYGYSVTSIDLVPAAVDAMRARFGANDQWAKEEGANTVTWRHASGRATLLVGDALQSRPELVGKFDAVYDKDSFGALGKDLRSGLCSRISEYTKPGGIVYLECKLKQNHEEVKDVGPPFSLTKEELMEDNCFGGHFDYAECLGSVYDLPMPGVQQTGHIMRRK